MEDEDMAALVRHDAAPADAGEIARLYKALDTVTEADHPRTARLIAAGRAKMAQKLIEEAAEVALDAARHRTRSVVRESADLVYQLAVLWRECGVTPEDVWAEMRRRADRFGLAEKRPKACEEAAAEPRAGRGA
jgi:phosphoribosyl-ATP pyrophosphohydrolase